MAFQKPKQSYTENIKDQLDFQRILWEGLNDMRKSIFTGDMNAFSASLQALEILLTPKILNTRRKAIGERYRSAYNKLETEYNLAIQKAGNNHIAKNLATYNKLLAWSKAIMVLVEDSGYMPEERGSYGRREYIDDDD